MITSEPMLKEWSTVNNVYFQNGKDQYGYVIRNHQGEERRISMKTANKMFRKGLLEFGFVMAVMKNKKHSLIRVKEGYQENLIGIDIKEE
jgi:hypothetical protein